MLQMPHGAKEKNISRIIKGYTLRVLKIHPIAEARTLMRNKL